jgi:hypothetical protein
MGRISTFGWMGRATANSYISRADLSSFRGYPRCFAAGYSATRHSNIRTDGDRHFVERRRRFRTDPNRISPIEFRSLIYVTRRRGIPMRGNGQQVKQ